MQVSGFVFLLTIASLLALAAPPCKGMQVAQDDSDRVVISLPVVRRLVSVEDRFERKFELYSFENSMLKVAELDGTKTTYRFDLPVGKYTLKDVDSGSYFAIPVIAAKKKKDQSELNFSIGKEKKATDDWAWIPAGPALIGDELGIGSDDERPIRIEHIEGFWLGRCEVTNEQYCKFLNAQKKADPKWIDLESRKCLIRKSTKGNGQFGYSVKTDRNKKAASMPVVMVSFFGARAYCDWLTETTGVRHRLPSETEWEKAARGPFSFVYSYSNRYLQWKANQESGILKEVKQYSPNAFGLYDMTGNAFEWMANRYDPKNESKTMNQSLRGGSFVLDGMYLRNSFRMRQSPTVMTDDIGFRVLRESGESSVEQE